MPPRRSLTRQPRRVLCLCTSYHCGDQEYVTPDGTYHAGVEVIPKTRATHQRADFRNNRAEAEPSHTPSHSYEYETSRSSAQDELIISLKQLELASTPSPSRHSKSLHQRDHHLSTNTTNDYPSSHASPSRQQDTSTHAADNPPINPPQESTKTCSAAVLAQASGVTVLDCGGSLFDHLLLLVKI